MTYKHILVPVDGSEISATVVKQASALAKTFNAKLTIVQVMTIDPYIAAEYLAYGQSSQIIERARNFILENINKAKELDRHYIRQSAVNRFSLGKIAPKYHQYFHFVWNVHKNGGYYANAAFRDISFYE